MTELDEHCSVAIAANRIKHTVLQALQHQVYPLDKLVEDINYRTDRSRPGLFNVLVDLQTAGTMTDSPVTEPEAAKNVQPGISTSMFDLCFEFRQHPEAIEGAIIYNTDLFDHKEIILMKKRFLQLAANLAQLQDWEQTIGNIEWKLESEKDSRFSGQLNADVQEFF